MARHSMRTLRFQYLLTPDGFGPAEIVVDDKGRIASVEAAASGDWDGWIALPGMINAHSHVFQRAMTGLAERGGGARSFWGWRELMYRIAGQITPESQFVIAEQAFREMLAAGFTSVGEFHYLHHEADGTRSTAMADAVVAAAQAAGIRLALLPVYYSRGGFDAAATTGQARFLHPTPEAFLDYAASLGPTVRGIAPHSLRAVDPAVLPMLVAGARQRLGDQSRFHIHIAEQQREVVDCEAAHGCGPVQLLCRHVDLDPRWSLVHATHASLAGLKAITAGGATVVLCPLTEAHLGDGIFPATDFIDGGGEFAIGSDCNARIDAIEELRLLEYGQRLASQRRPCLLYDDGPGVGLWQAACAGGARSLGLDAGAIRPGLAADLVVLERSAPLDGLAPCQALDAWLVGGSRENIEHIYVDGRRIDPNRATTTAFTELVRELAVAA